jgi:hypothetical protein
MEPTRPDLRCRAAHSARQAGEQALDRNAGAVIGGALAATLASGWAIWTSDGWGVLIWLPCCLVAGVIHLLVQLLVVRSTPASVVARLTAHVSNAIFLLAFLLQVDEGDGPRWIIATAGAPELWGSWSRLPAWWPAWINLLAFGPLLGSWALLVRRSGHA